jgi:hypothetical protein
MPDLNAEIRERLNDWAENALNPQAAAGALLAVLDLHKSADEQDGDWQDGPHWPCQVCHDGPFPCATRRAIAAELGIEAVHA